MDGLNETFGRLSTDAQEWRPGQPMQQQLQAGQQELASGGDPSTVQNAFGPPGVPKT